MVQRPFSRNYSRNEQTVTTGFTPCAVCGKPIRDGAWPYAVHIHNGGDVIVTEAEAKTLDPAADLGGYPLGRDCLRNHPELLPYVQEAA